MSGRRGEPWRVEREPKGGRVRVTRPDGTPTPWQRVLVARPFGDGVITVDKKRYRGDVMVLPAGVGHHNLMSSEDFLVVGAYPPAGEYDLCTGEKGEHEKALASVPKVPPPESDPVYGADGPLAKLWRRTSSGRAPARAENP